MKHEDILKLINAGYTKADIEAMESAEDKAPEPKEETVPEPKAETKSEPATDVIGGAITDAIGELKGVLEDFKKEFATFNILSSNIPEANETAEDIIGKIINPYTDE